jgi:hypothetical protein
MTQKYFCSCGTICELQKESKMCVFRRVKCPNEKCKRFNIWMLPTFGIHKVKEVEKE